MSDLNNKLAKSIEAQNSAEIELELVKNELRNLNLEHSNLNASFEMMSSYM